MRVTPNHITQLQPDEIFVFGSNLSGIHGGGAARVAHEKFGAVWGVGSGITGQCYALPTKSENIERTLTVDEIKGLVDQFIEVAKSMPHLCFLVTEVGCGLAGLSVDDIAPLFKEATHIQNIHLPLRFWHVLQH